MSPIQTQPPTRQRKYCVLSTRYSVLGTRKAHSLIELLVVLIIVGVLIAIIVPAVQRSREAARMAQCIHNQAQLAKAVHMHLADEPYGRYPGYRAFGADGTTVIGWAPQVFEYLGRSDLNPTQATYIDVLVCPSNQGPKDQPRLNYVVNGGQPDLDSPADGIFFDHAKDAKVYITKDDFRDGLTNTILLAENLDATQWNVTDETNQCILWPLTAGNEVNKGTGARPSSHHPGGFVAAFADGSVKFMNETQLNDDPAVYVALLTPGGDDAEAVSGGAGGGEGGTGPTDCTGTTGDLFAHWPFENSGGDAGADATGNGFDGLTFGGATVVSDSERGDVLELDGVDDYFGVDTQLDIQGSCYSATVWFKSSVSSARQDILSCHVGTNHGLLIELESASSLRFLHRVPISTGGGTNLYDGSGTYPDSAWHHVAAVKDGSDLRLYLDGVEVATGVDASIYPVDFVVKVGRLKDGSGRFFGGRIDDVRIYGRTLSPVEVATLAGN